MDIERFIALAEIEYKTGNTMTAISYAKKALKHTENRAKITALKIFIARAYTKIGDIGESNRIYRELIREEIYAPPVVMGLLHNNFSNARKTGNNLRLMRIFVGGKNG